MNNLSIVPKKNRYLHFDMVPTVNQTVLRLPKEKRSVSFLISVGDFL
jgi:hypothetical protein